MTRFLLGLMISFIFNSFSFAQEIIYDLDVKRGFEIIGTDERPRVIFFMPELKLPIEKREIDIKFVIKDSLIEKDIDEYLKANIEESKIK